LAGALYGQLSIRGGEGVVLATRCYAAGLVLWLLTRPGAIRFAIRAPAPLGATANRPRLRAAAAVAAAVLGIFALWRLHATLYDSDVGAGAWLLAVLLAAWSFRGRSSRRARDPIRAKELVLVALVLCVAAFFRFHRLGDWLSGMHGDEGEAGLDASRILRGEHVPPFAIGWFSQGNLYYWGVALGMKLAGVSLAGLRLFSAAAGVLLLVPTWLLAREAFGRRVALLAAAFLAISDVAVNFSRLEFSNVTTPLSLALGFWLLLRGLARGSAFSFLLAGYAHAAGLYFYQGARLTPFLAAGFLVFLLAGLPLLSAAHAVWRRRSPAAALRSTGRRSRRLLVPCALYVFALALFGGPFFAYSLDYRQDSTSRVKQKIVFNNEARVADLYAARHEPLAIGLRLPKKTDALPLPVVAERTALSVTVARDGFWPAVLWGQLMRTLSVLTYRLDESSVYTFAQAPITKPIEAVLVVFGLAFLLAAPRDPRGVALSIWFWGTVAAGGVLTIDPPYMARLVGFLPVLAVAAALSLDALASAFDRVAARVSGAAWRLAGAILAAAVLLVLARENFVDYFERYTRATPLPFAPTTGTAWYVRGAIDRARAREEAPPFFHDLSAHLLYWKHSVIQFLVRDANGEDFMNPAQSLPLTRDVDGDSVFLVWDLNRAYLRAIERFYPGGRAARYEYGPRGRGTYLFTAYTVGPEEVRRSRSARATYTPARGPEVTREEPGFGASAPPAELSYPARARWSGALVAPGYGRYRLEARGGSEASLTIDGVPVFAKGETRGEVLLARGLHETVLEAALPTASTSARLLWAAVGRITHPIAPRFLFREGRGGFLGIVRLFEGGGSAREVFDTPGFESLPFSGARVDQFLGFKEAGSAFGGRPFVARFRGRLASGTPRVLRLELRANPPAAVYVDRRRVAWISEDGPRVVPLDVSIGRERRELEVWYGWTGGFGTLELFQRGADGALEPFGPAELEPVRAAFPPGSLPEPAFVPDLGDSGVKAVRSLDTRKSLADPKALAVSAAGDIVVADTGNRRIARIGAGGAVLQRRSSRRLEGPQDVALDRGGRIWTLESKLPRIEVFAPDGTFEREIPVPGLCSPAGFGIAPNGAIWVADTCNGRVVRVSEEGRIVAEVRPRAPDRFEQPVDVAVGADGTLYVADLTPRVLALDASGGIRRKWNLPVSGSSGGSNLALCGSHLFLSNPDRDLVEAIDVVSGEILEFRGAAGAELSMPVGVGCSPRGELVVGDRRGARIQVFVDPLPPDGAER
jgi:sugar lactone lactonase YvrE/4-amino-4-deoxy-L-arabinose transferase-like glycosyltransferase